MATLLDVNFDDWALGSPSVAYWNERLAGGQKSGVDAELKRHEVIRNPDGAGNVCRLTLLAGVVGPRGGTGMMVPLGKPVEDAAFEARFKLVGTGYDFGRGQKFPGLSGVQPGINPSFPSGGNTVTDEGFSVRHMQKGRRGMCYVYGSDVRSDYGEDAWWEPSTGLTPNVWHTLSSRVRLNAPASSDGIVSTSWDGAKVYERTNRRLRVRPDVQITHLMWSWFYGGSTADWAPKTNQRILIDYVRVTIPDPPLSARLSVAMTAAELAEVRAKAAAAGLSMSAYARKKITQ
jgi:hypothetical protein